MTRSCSPPCRWVSARISATRLQPHAPHHAHLRAGRGLPAPRGAPPQASPGSGGSHRLRRRLLPRCLDSRASRTHASPHGSAAGLPCSWPPGRPDRPLDRPVRSTGPARPGHGPAMPAPKPVRPAPGPGRELLLAVVAAAVVAVGVVATAVAMLVPTSLRLVHLSTPPLRHGPPVTIRGPGSFTPTPCLCRAPLPGLHGAASNHPPGVLRGAPARPGLRRPPGSTPWDPALLTTLQSAPSAGAYGGGGDWFMDTGASAHMDAHPVPSNSGYNYYLVILDDYSHFVWTFPLRRKSDVVSTQFGRPIHALQTDNDKEFDNITIRSLLAARGAVFRLMCPYTSPQNGRAERMLRTLNDCVRTLLFHASMPPRFWPDALATATLLVNIRPCRVCWSYTPHHLLYGAPPAYDDLRIFGCRCYPNTAAIPAHKLAPRSLPRVFLGYPANTKGYRWTLGDTSDDATSARRPSCGRAPKTNRGGPLCAGPAWSLGVSVAPGAPASVARRPVAATSPSAASSSAASSPASPPVAAAPDPMLTCARRSNRSPGRPVRSAGRFNRHCDRPDDRCCIPLRSFAGAHLGSRRLARPTLVRCHAGGVRCAAAQPDLVPRPPRANVITGKWVFKDKLGSDGTLERYKARWVMRGFRQRAGVDFTDTFVPVVKPGTIRTVLHLDASRAWPVHQMDVSNAFLHGHLQEQAYYQQPIGFVDTERPDDLGFRSTRSDASLFVYRTGNDMAYLLLYVDDIILTASTAGLLRQLTDSLRAEFALKDLGPLHYFLSIEVVRRADGFFLHRRKNAHELLERVGMLNCNPAPTPVDTKAKLSASDGSLALDAPFYRSIVGALQYLTLTRPELQYAVQQHTVSRSNAEAEYRAVANAVAECTWLRQLLSELSCPVDKATVVFCDNVSAVYLSANPFIIAPSTSSWTSTSFVSKLPSVAFEFFTYRRLAVCRYHDEGIAVHNFSGVSLQSMCRCRPFDCGGWC
ncbi:hypothetical protein QYE76_028026 [Lolium multiflorum]|uniref:Integrase catalytic domain-containing protein n=1 Tax=Lolium multiflorum TaxID=4521 RepID=A0AAD8VGR6_LOLMU|nr:hypothetical protein QYE76_028026 [Lolium multiflorum]